MQTAHELFIHELKDMLDAERQLLEALARQSEESSRPELRKAFEQHRAQTEKQVERLEQCFEEIGEQPDEAACAGMRGLIQEHDDFKDEDPSEEILDIFNVVAATKVERYEISAYDSMIRLAQQMKHRQSVKLLNQNLREEQQMLKKVDAFGKKFKPTELGMGEVEIEEEEEAPRRGRSRRGRVRRAA